MKNSARGARALLGISLVFLLSNGSTFAQEAAPPTQAEIDEVFKLVKHPDANLSKAAVDWLVTVGEPAIPGFIAALGESDDYGCDNMCAALSRLGKLAVPALTKALDSDSVPVLRGAVNALADIGLDAAPAAPALVKILTHGDDRLSGFVTMALRRSGADVMPELVETLTTCPPAARNGVVRTIGAVKTRPDMAIPALTAALKDPSLVQNAADALAVYGPAAVDAVPALLELTKSLNPDSQHDAYICVLRAIYYAKRDAMPSLPETTQAELTTIIKARGNGGYYPGHSLEKEPIPDLQTARAKLEEEKDIVAHFKEEPTPSRGKLSPGDIEWEVVRAQVPSDQEGARQYEYVLRLKGDPQQAHLVKGNEVFDEEEAGYAFSQAVSDSFCPAWLRPPDLISVAWSNEPEPGSGAFTYDDHAIFLKTPSGWKNVYSNSYLSFAKSNVRNHITGSEIFIWNSEANTLKVTLEETWDDESSSPHPLSTAQKSKGGYESYVRKVTVTSERLFQLKGEQLEYLGGKRVIDPGPGTFKLAEVPPFFFRDKTPPEEVLARLRKLNPKLGKSEEFQGPLILETGIPVKDKDE